MSIASSQANNVFVFPGVGLGASLGATGTVSDGMLIAAAEALPALIDPADLARGAVYGEKIVCHGPLFRSHRVEGNRVVLDFDEVGGGLVARSELKDFTICDASGEFVPAEAKIVGDTVVVSSARIAKPIAVRYGWRNFFEPSLFNREGFSATSFRTDTFKLKTQDNR